MGSLSLLLLFSLQNAFRAVLAINLTQSTFDEDDKSWSVTVPAQWDFATILGATGNGSMVDNPEELLESYTLPYPGFPITESTVLDGSDSRFAPLIYVNDTFSRYATNAANYALMRALSTSDASYSDETWAIPVTCEWPISGGYSRLNRVLYYVLLVFALVAHHHEWLVAGALASATIYSGCAAVQAVAQFAVINLKTPHDSAGDNDNEAIMGILAAGLLMAVPLINWSRTLRRLQTRPLLIYWALIIFIGYLFVIIGQKQTQFSNGWNRKDGGMMTCNTQEQIPAFKDLGFIDHDFITQYNCNDPCYSPVQQHPLRDASSIVARVDCNQFTWTDLTGTAYSCFTQCPRSISDTCFIAHEGWTKQDYTLNNVGYYGVLPVAVFELFFVLCFGRKSPEEIRDKIFGWIVGASMMGDFRAMSPEKRRQTPKSFRVRVAQTVAMVFYLFAAFTYFVCLPFFVFSIIWQERLLRFFPDAETSYEISQWLPWVGVALTLGAAIVGKYHHAWHVHLSHLFFGRRAPRAQPVTKAKNKGRNFAYWLQRKTWRTRSRLYLEFRDLRDFISQPFYLILDDSRDRTSDHPTVKFSFAGNLPYPLDEERNTKEHYQGPWIKNDDTWSQFPVEFQVEADDRTLRSWERYQSRPRGVNEHIVYSIMLPDVPTHPDRRTVIAKADVSNVLEKAMVDDLPSSKQSDVREALVPGARKQSTMAFSLQAVSIPADMDPPQEDADANSLNRTDTMHSGHAQGREQSTQTPEPAQVPRYYTPTPGSTGGPLHSHHLTLQKGPSHPLANHEEANATRGNEPHAL